MSTGLSQSEGVLALDHRNIEGAGYLAEREISCSAKQVNAVAAFQPRRSTLCTVSL